jgi:uncharacterized protein YbjT (DUF2867 family)
MILVTGATGNCGRSLVAELNSLGAPLRALTRDPEKALLLPSDGVEVAIGDFESPPELQAALEGVEGVFLNSSQHPQLAELQGNVVDAAKKAGVKRIVKVSGGSGITGESSLSWVGRHHSQVERQIEESEVDHTFLRPTYYMQNLLQLAGPVRKGNLPVPLGDERLALIDSRDVGAVAAKILTEDGRHTGKVYDLTGPETLSFGEVAERFSRVFNHEVSHVVPSLDAAVETLRANGAPGWLQQHFREIMTLFRAGVGSETSETVRELTGQSPRTIEDFARDHADAFAPEPAVER